jgi:hypothetical protein
MAYFINPKPSRLAYFKIMKENYIMQYISTNAHKIIESQFICVHDLSADPGGRPV